MEEDAEKTATVVTEADTLAGDLVGEDNVVKDGLVDSRQGAAAGSLLLEGHCVAGLLADDATL